MATSTEVKKITKEEAARLADAINRGNERGLSPALVSLYQEVRQRCGKGEGVVFPFTVIEVLGAEYAT